MYSYSNLLEEISQNYHIPKGKTENELDWKARIIYSICGMMAYTSLWDYDDEGPISNIHIKKRIKNILSAYKEIYPEVSRRIVLESKA